MKKVLNLWLKLWREASAFLFSFDTDDSGNADRVISKFGKDILFDKAVQKFLIWNGKRWMIDAGRMVKQMVENVLNDYRNAVKSLKNASFSEVRFHALTSWNNSRLNAVVDILKHRMEIEHEVFDKHPELLNVRNGVIDLRTGKIMPHQRSLLLTAYIDVDFNPNLDVSQSELAKFLYSVCCGEEKLCKYLKSCFGDGVTGETKEQVFFILYGKGGNGKTTLIEAISGVLGDYAKNIPIETLTGVTDSRNGARPSPELAHINEVKNLCDSI